MYFTTVFFKERVKSKGKEKIKKPPIALLSRVTTTYKTGWGDLRKELVKRGCAELRVPNGTSEMSSQAALGCRRGKQLRPDFRLEPAVVPKDKLDSPGPLLSDRDDMLRRLWSVFMKGLLWAEKQRAGWGSGGCELSEGLGSVNLMSLRCLHGMSVDRSHLS